jgi:hypothetical protein
VRAALVVAASFAGVVASAAVVLAQPSIPATFYGSVTVDGEPAAAGVEVRGLVNGMDCTQSDPGERPVIRDGETAAYVLYVVHESQRPGCARDGSTITFTIGERPAVQTATWKPGPQRLDLSVGSAPPIPLPSPTGTVAAAIETAIGTAGAATSAPTLGPRPTGTPPTDDVRFDGTPVPPGGQATAQAADDGDGGGSGLVIVLGALAVLAIAGGAAGIALSRRRRPAGP